MILKGFLESFRETSGLVSSSLGAWIDEVVLLDWQTAYLVAEQLRLLEEI